jgi:hypothetical protein
MTRIKTNSRFFVLRNSHGECIGKYDKPSQTVVDEGPGPDLPNGVEVIELDDRNSLNDYSVSIWWDDPE